MLKKILIFSILLLFCCIFGVKAQNKALPFTVFSYFIDKLKLPGKIGLIWATPRSTYEGPFHTNDELHIDLPPDYFQQSRSPFFRGPVTTAGSSVVYYKSYGPTDSMGQINEEKLSTIFQSTIKTGIPKITLPEYPEGEVKKGALNGKSLASSDPTVYLPCDSGRHLTGGIYVRQNLDALMFDSRVSQPLDIQFVSGKEATQVEVNFTENKTLVKRPNNKMESYVGVPNGAIFVEGDIGNKSKGGVSGTVKGKWTIASDRDIFIADHLLYVDTPRGNKPQGDDTLALIARNVFIAKDAPDILFLYATIFAAKKEDKEMLGTLFVFPNPEAPHQGKLIWWGSYIGEYPAIMGSFDKDTGDSKDGYDLQKYYDARLATDPPPFFPTLTN